ncbi:hypothetical protein [Streptomyces fractus]|uniref:hypothetical protein n=1 Tax=Streptomyces fractus TaxID=641806 RepID=UPI003CF031FC
MREHLPQRLDLVQAPQPRWRVGLPYGGQQTASVFAEGLGECGDAGRTAGYLADLYAVPVALVPARLDQRGQEVRVLAGQFLQRRPHALTHQLQAAGATDHGQHMGGVGALSPDRP